MGQKFIVTKKGGFFYGDAGGEGEDLLEGPQYRIEDFTTENIARWKKLNWIKVI